MANVDRDNRDNMLNEEQESSQSNSSTGSGAVPQQSTLSGSGFQLKSSILRQPATFGSGAGAGGGLGGLFGNCSTSGSSGHIGSFNLKPSVLKPSHLGGFGSLAGDQKEQDQNETNSNSFSSNPFLKTQNSEEEPETKTDEANVDKEENSGDPLAKLNRSSLPKSNLFANVKSISEDKGFVFGQNVHERVTGENIQADSSGPTAGLSFSSTLTNNSNDSSSSNSVVVAGGSTTGTAMSGSKPEGNDESLEEAARRYEESRGALKRKFDEVETITGEEDERNVVEINCKLFAFAKSNWEERGHGTLRLNDKDSRESRVVFRQAGNLRVIINTKVWSGMTADQSSHKSLRFTAMDNNGQVKVFLVMSRPDVIAKLHKELTKRILTAKETAAEQDDEAGKENNNDNASSVRASEENCPESTENAKDEPGNGEPCAKKRLNSST
ncbi:ran-binding protein 3 [Toxorhynchites rutilus septentrionalis]|uniref:ran-binding protein 3 n=1 Tax=Toxorhynchites rutilus septentrionalis TaxID=329112 RepID=UPI00247874EC|nr:ran-binding protein 3 [Toxorhynchites rutilus septentrionalis]